MEDVRKRTLLSTLIRDESTPAAGERLVFVSRDGKTVHLDQRSRLADPLNLLGLSPVVICLEPTIRPVPIELRECMDTATRQKYDITVDLVQVQIGKDDEDQKRFAGYFANILPNERDNRFRDRLRDWGRARLEGRQRLTVEFSRQQRDIEQEFCKWIRDTCGLDATVHIAFNLIEKEYRLDGIGVPGAACDVDKPLITRISLKAVPDPTFDPASSSRSPMTQQDLKPLVEAATRDFIRKEVSLNRYYFNVDPPPPAGTPPAKPKPAWRGELRDIVDAQLRERGYLVSDFSVAAEPAPYHNEQSELKSVGSYVPVHWSVGADKIVVECRAQMRLENAALYETAQLQGKAGSNEAAFTERPPIQSWLDMAYQKAVQEALFDATFTKLLVHWAKSRPPQPGVDPRSYESRLREAIAHEAKKIGYALTALVSRPKLDAIDLPDGVRIVVGKDRNSKEAAYETKDIDVMVLYSIEASFRIPDLTRIELKLNQNPDITKHIGDVLRDEAVFFTKGKTAEDYYLRFSRWKEEAPRAPVYGGDLEGVFGGEGIEIIGPGDRSDSSAARASREATVHDGFENELAKLLAQKLASEFFADNITVRIFQHPTEITELFQQLTSLGARRIDFVFKPYGNQTVQSLTVDHSEIPISIELAVKGMAAEQGVLPSGWNRFQRFAWKEELARLKRSRSGEAAEHTGYIDVILDTIKRALTNDAMVVAFNQARFRTDTERISFSSLLQTTVDRALREEFGLTGRIVNLSRAHTAGEELMYEGQRAKLKEAENAIKTVRIEQETRSAEIDAERQRLVTESEDRQARRALLLAKRREMIEAPGFDSGDSKYQEIEEDISKIGGGRAATGDAGLVKLIEGKREKDRARRLELLADDKKLDSPEVLAVEERIAMWDGELAKLGANRSGAGFAQFGLLEDQGAASDMET